MRVLVCGSRSWTNYAMIKARLRRLPEGAQIIHGGADGADTFAHMAAAALGLPTMIFYADWKQHGRKAGVLRNLVMLDEQPDLVIAFSKDRSPGTEHTITEARKRGLTVEVHRR